MSKAMETDIQYLPGVGPRRAALLRSELEVATVGDLVRLYPFRYIDRSSVQKIADLRPDQSYVQVVATVLKVRLFAKNGAELPADKLKYNLVNRLSAIIGDDTSASRRPSTAASTWSIPSSTPPTRRRPAS